VIYTHIVEQFVLWHIYEEEPG